MKQVQRKIETLTVDGTPEKRMFWSIISDYDLKTGIFELIDNALDLWISSNKIKPLQIEIDLDEERQFILIKDNAGGVRKDDLRLLIAPGGSKNDPSAHIIGIFGVGGKRAGIALGEQVHIKTRHNKELSYQLDINKDWLETDDWELSVYQIPDIDESTTQIEISQLRKSFSSTSISEIKQAIGETYAWFIRQGCTIVVNETSIEPIGFDNWAYPPSFLPQNATFSLDYGVHGQVLVSITAGLIIDRKPDEDNYGVYFYCNNRLILKELKTREVGYFVRSEAGVPHPDASLCRVIVDLDGPANLMPWNSSKSGINFDHIVFNGLRSTLIPMVSHFSSLSRRLKMDWEKEVFSFAAGKIESVDPADPSKRKRVVLPKLPRVRKRYVEQLVTQNDKLISDQPWTLGLVESVAAVSTIERQHFQTKNRMALILLDSTFEIAIKEFIVHRTDLFPPKVYNQQKISEIFSKRHLAISELTKHVTIPPLIITKANHYYEQRNKLIHERATIQITDSDVQNYQQVVQQFLQMLFGLSFK